MHRKYLIIVVFFVLMSLVALGASLIFIDKQNELNVRGKYTFNNSKDDVQKISLIKINTYENGEINIYYKDGVWKFKEAADYFINPQMLANFYNMINNSIIIDVNKVDDNTLKEKNLLSYKEAENGIGQGVEIQTIDEKGNILDDFIIGNKTDKPEHYFVRKANTNYMYNVSSIRGFSGLAQAWIPYPLLSVENFMIEALVIDRKYIDRELLDKVSTNSEFIKAILRSLNFLEYDGITTRDDFFEAYPKARYHQLKVITVLGLVYVFDIYKVDDNYWLKLTLETTKIPDKDVIPFVENNQKYFEDWMFQMDASQGDILYNTKLR